jgi:hypothetical protein
VIATRRRHRLAELDASTAAGECGVKLAAAALNGGLAGAGIAHRWYRPSDSSCVRALPKL